MPLEVSNRAECALKEFSSAQPLPRSSISSPNPNKIFGPLIQRDVLKECCDATFDKKIRKAAVAIIERDCTGAIVFGDTICFLAPTASSAEAEAIRLGISLASNAGLDQVLFEYDCLGVVQRLNSGVLTAWESASIEEDILSRKYSFSSISFSLIPKLVTERLTGSLKTSYINLARWIGLTIYL
ncbi:hypothetical protein GQ457_09G013050 [Hibiscus cannabinus]